MTAAVLIYGGVVALIFVCMYIALTIWALRELQKPDTRREERQRFYDAIFKRH